MLHPRGELHTKAAPSWKTRRAFPVTALHVAAARSALTARSSALTRRPASRGQARRCEQGPRPGPAGGRLRERPALPVRPADSVATGRRQFTSRVRSSRAAWFLPVCGARPPSVSGQSPRGLPCFRPRRPAEASGALWVPWGCCPQVPGSSVGRDRRSRLSPSPLAQHAPPLPPAPEGGAHLFAPILSQVFDVLRVPLRAITSFRIK